MYHEDTVTSELMKAWTSDGLIFYFALEERDLELATWLEGKKLGAEGWVCNLTFPYKGDSAY